MIGGFGGGRLRLLSPPSSAAAQMELLGGDKIDPQIDSVARSDNAFKNDDDQKMETEMFSCCGGVGQQMMPPK